MLSGTSMVLNRIASIEENPLKLEDRPIPQPGSKQILIKVSACGICHTELDEIEGRLIPRLPVVPGHEIIGRVVKSGVNASRFKPGDRVGVAWINSACGKCYFCMNGNENLCAKFKATGCDVDGGYSEYTVVLEDFAYKIPEIFKDTQAAPLMCAGAIGYRALKLTDLKNNENIGLYGFGASAHIVIQMVKYRYPDSNVFVFTRNRDDLAARLARKMGADWIGITGDTPPEKLHRVIDTTPLGIPVQEALRNLEKGGKLVINLIRKETPIPELDYTEHLWYEKEIKSVTNITRNDVEEFLSLASEIPITSKIREFKLKEANHALNLLKKGKYQGAGVLKI
ncbi:MAG: zinc-dependent alcohol dehydrogenase family protein [Methanobacteriaceae archaeon]|jgi:propanol-preferring alcohol dehydrogenase